MAMFHRHRIVATAALCALAACHSDAPCGCDVQVNQFVVSQALQCWCQDRDCTPSLAQAQAQICKDLSGGASLYRKSGCGLVELPSSTNLSGLSRTFDARTGRLVGTYLFS